VRWLAKRAGKQRKYNPKKRFVNSRSAATPTRSGASNLDATIDEGTLTIGWVGPALLGILIAAFGWAGRLRGLSTAIDRAAENKPLDDSIIT
jgi:hypothetical protein